MAVIYLYMLSGFPEIGKMDEQVSFLYCISEKAAVLHEKEGWEKVKSCLSKDRQLILK